MVAADVENGQQLFDGAAEAVGGEVDFGVESVTNFGGAAQFVAVAAEAAVASVGDQIGMVGQAVEAIVVATQELAAKQFKQASPGRDAGGGRAVEDVAVRSFESEVFVDRVGRFAVEFGEYAIVFFPVVAAGLFAFGQSDAGVLLHHGRDVFGDAIELGHAFDIDAHELHAFVESTDVLPVDRIPNVIRQGKQVFSNRFEFFKDVASACDHELVIQIEWDRLNKTDQTLGFIGAEVEWQSKFNFDIWAQVKRVS